MFYHRQLKTFGGGGALQQVKFNGQAFTYWKLAGDLKDVDISHALYGNTIYIYFN